MVRPKGKARVALLKIVILLKFIWQSNIQIYFLKNYNFFYFSQESALSTAVWSVLKAKRRMLQYSDGFLAHFYDLAEHLSPVLAWGFLGPADELNQVCLFFKVCFLAQPRFFTLWNFLISECISEWFQSLPLSKKALSLSV